jgi:hypothetical protein
MLIILGESKTKALNGSELTTYHYIERETPKAVLLKIEKSADGMMIEKNEYWLPRSQIKLDHDKIEVADWLWEKKLSGE